MGLEKEVEKSYSTTEVVAKLRRLADALEEEKTFEIRWSLNTNAMGMKKKLKLS